MAESTLKDLSPALRALATKAREAATGGDPQLAADLCARILEDEPTCLPVRELQFRCCFELRGEAAPGWRPRLPRWLQGKARGGADEGWREVDARLNKDFQSVAAWRALAAVAGRETAPGTARMAWQSVARIHPDDRAVAREAAAALLDLGWANDAMEVLQRARSRHPHDADLEALVQRAAVAQTMRSGQWEAAGDFRSKRRKRDA